MKHRHVQTNIKQTMSVEEILQDVQAAFYLAPDSIVFNEARSPAIAAVLACAADLGYGTFIPSHLDKNASQNVIAWKKKLDLEETFEESMFCMSGRKKVSPHRYYDRVRLVESVTAGRSVRRFSKGIGGTQMVSSGWTGSKSLDAWRQKGWYAHEAVMAAILRRQYRHNDLVIWSGDCNRPPTAFPGFPPDWSKVLPKFQIKGAKTSMVVRTGHTHGGITFDYVGILSRNLEVMVDHWSTPHVNSDHQQVVVDLTWVA
jgi:hypothetical protein